MSRKGAKKRTHGRKLRSTGTKAGRRVIGSNSPTELQKQLAARTRELAEALEQQAATSEVLQVISSSRGELGPVFQAMLENATRICEADFGNLLLYEGNAFRIAARIAAPHGAAPAWAELQRGDPTVHPHPKDALARVVRTKRLQHVADLRTEEAYVEGDRSVVGLADVAGARTVLVVPMLKENELIGVLAIYRREVRPFTEKQIELVQSFADQAVIAIENARLLNELRRRTDDLSQALEHQTATGEILASIGGAITDAKPVFDAIVRNLRRLFGTRLAMVQILKDGMVHLAAAGHEQEFEKLVAQFPRPLDESTGSGGVMLSKQAVQFAPVAGNPAVPVVTQQFARELGFNAVIYAPMIREGMVIGAIGAARHEPKPFDDKQVALIKAFADQAVIAIENVRLFDEVQARTRELTEALEQQTATSEVLKVISRSPTNIQPVLDAVGENAARLCQANNAVIFRLEDGLLRQVADYGQIPTSSHPSEGLPVNRDTVTGRAVFERRTLHIHDLSTEDREFPEGTSACETRRSSNHAGDTAAARGRSSRSYSEFDEWKSVHFHRSKSN